MRGTIEFIDQKASTMRTSALIWRFVVVLIVMANFASALMKHPSRCLFVSRQNGVPDWLVDGVQVEQKVQTIPGVTVRFINTPTGKDVVAYGVEEGSNLLSVGDNVGVKLPRACRNGICGACTCDIQDPLAIETETNPRAGFATMRACSTKCRVPDGMTEMIVDVRRMRKAKKSSSPDGEEMVRNIITSS